MPTPSAAHIAVPIAVVCMFCGRLGAIAIVMLIGGQEDRTAIRYPKEELVVG